MNRKTTKETLEEKMARVAEKKQQILEKKIANARKFMTPRVHFKKSNSLNRLDTQDDLKGSTQRVNSIAENGWEKRPNGWVKTYSSINYKDIPCKAQKLTKEKLEQKMARVEMRRQRVLEEKKQKARRFTSAMIKPRKTL